MGKISLYIDDYSFKLFNIDKKNRGDILEESYYKDKNNLADIIKKYAKNNKIKHKKVFVIINSNKLDFVIIKVENVNPRDINSYINNNYSEYINLDINDYVLDYAFLNKENLNEILLVTLYKDVSTNIVEIIKNSGLKLVSIIPFHIFIANYVSKLHSNGIIIFNYINKIYVILLQDKVIKNIRETYFSQKGDYSKLNDLLVFSGFNFNKIYVFTKDKWLIEYLITLNTEVIILEDKDIFS